MASSTTSITSAPDPSVCGQDVVFTAIVSPVPPETATPTGDVTFIVSDDGPSIVVPLDGAGQAQAVFSGLGVGVHQAVAVYSGDGTFDPSSSPLDNHTVNLADSTTTVVADPNPSVCGEPVELCAVVVIDSPGIGIPTGTVTFTGPGGLNQTATLDVAGEACISTAVLSDGTVTATYNGDDCAAGSIGTVTVAVDPAPTTTVVTAEPDPSVCGEFVEICAVVTVDPPGAGLPTGTVTFTGPGGLNQTVTLDNTGQACLTYNLLATGTITATYNGDACAATSTGTVGVTVNPADSTTAVSADPDPSVCGQSVEICAVVTPTAPSSSTPTGTVTFTGPGGLNQTVTLGGGQACLNTTALATGTVTATYNGSPCHNGSVGTTTVTVEAADTTTDVTATPDPSVCGQSVTVCATVAVIPPGGGTPNGSVTFTGPGGFNQTVALDGMGQACLTTTALATGTVVATYNGAACFNSSSDTVAVTVNPAASTTVVSADPNPSVCGQSVEICATVTTNPPGSGTPTGSVIFTGPGGLNQTVALDGMGEACLTTTSLATGTVVATYTGDACHTGSTGTFGVTVDPAETTTVVTADPDPSVCGESVEICATVTTDPPGSGTPTGSVIFTGPGGLNQTVPLNGAGQACLTTNVLTDGTVTATYSGESPCFAGSVGTVAVTVDPADTTTTVSADPNPSVCGESVEVCALVTTNPPGSGVPTGTVTFTGPGGLNQTVPLDGAGEACLTTASLTDGTITAVYNGDACHNTSTGTLAITVDPAATTTVVTADPNPSVCGQSVEVCALVTIDEPGSGTPTGTVTFTGPGGLNQTVPLDGSGEACLTTTSLATGTVTATYNGDACAATSTGTVTVTVNPAATTTVVTAEPDPSVCGESVELCALVTTNAPGSGTPTGTVTFTGPGGLNQTVPLNGAGQACLTTTVLADGTVTATYNGDSPCFAGSVGTVTVTVDPADTTTTVSADPNPSVCGDTVEICATVTTNPPGSGVPTGTVTFTGPGGLNQTVPLNGAGEACITTASLTDGTVTAVYNGDACHNTSTGTLAITVDPADTTTTVSADPNPSVCGQSVEICALVTTNPPGSGTPTGTVTFTGPGGLNQTVALDGAGQACITTASLTDGTVTAVYNGDACHNTSTGTLAITVDPAATTTVVSADPNPSVCGQSVEVCALVTIDEPGSGTPTGTVTFTGPGGLNQTVPLDGSGEACLTTTSLATGTVVATYNGDACAATSTGTVTVTVNPAATSTAVSVTPNPSVCGQSVTVCATVTTNLPGSGIPTGTVTFTGPGGLNQTVTLNSAGEACITTTVLATGTITATYNGDSPCFAGSVGTAAVTVNPANTTTTVSAFPNPSVCGQSVTVCAIVATSPPGSGVPTGTVTFTGPGGLNQTVVLDGSGQACITTTSLATGTITAVYNGDTCHNTSTGTRAVTVNPAATTTVVTATPNPSVCGQSVTVCATVTTNPPGSGVPTGTVTFTGPGGLNQTVPLNGAGQACLTTTSLATGTITAVYNGDTCHNTSTGTVAVTVNPAATTTVVTATPNPSVCGQSVELCAVVTTNAPGSGVPTGTVTFTGPGGLNQTVALDVTGEACFTTTALTDGTVTATYNGESPCFAGSVGTVAVTVDPAPTSTVVTATPNPSVCGQSVELCATVTVNPPGAGLATGTVTFTGPGGLNQTATLDGTGEACITTTVLSTGTVTATYSGDGCAASSAGTTAVTVNPAATTTDVTATPNPSVCGQSVTVCATVTTNAPGSGTPTGTVTFTGPGGLNQTATLNGAGQACITTTSLATGTITATYNGDTCHNTSTDTVAVTVNPANTTTAVTATPNPSVCGQSVTVCATVTTNAPGSGTPTGTVTFTGPGGLNQTVTLNGAGQACLTTTALATGTITATYNGDTCHNTSTGTVAVTVNPANTTTVVTATPNPSVCGQSVTVCATVTTNAPGSGTPTGTVTFTGPGGLNQTIALNGAGQACLTTTALATGTITAVYNGDTCHNTSTGTRAVTVNRASTTTAVTATPNPSVCGQSVTVCATVTTNAPGSGTPTGTVTFTGPGGLNQTVTLNGAGQACFTSTSLATGTITAVYNGDTCHNTSTGTVSITSTVTATTLTAPPAQVRLRTNGQFVIPAMSATLKESVSGNPIAGRTVLFTANRPGVPIVLGSAVTDANGVATLAPPNFPVSPTVIAAPTYTASFAGAGCLGPSSATASLTYVPIPLLP
ncbi:Ig-like domain-containing protein [Streptomyces albidus (ex Kaewkla and Franco 2022)]|uniref:Ig-like domain-containing protein n=1 Tax=Streptomyces albidus (ex Kaewkla and Franco 2022) TaxID=722709 RepID=UPI0015EEBA0B|nr:Ig-like domain-containing protein [Streptomyces albidus (ex Kaewkla and Franco 2022)]